MNGITRNALYAQAERAEDISMMCAVASISNDFVGEFTFVDDDDRQRTVNIVR